MNASPAAPATRLGNELSTPTHQRWELPEEARALTFELIRMDGGRVLVCRDLSDNDRHWRQEMEGFITRPHGSVAGDIGGNP